MGTQLGMLEKKYDVEVVSNAIDTRFRVLVDTAYEKTGRPVVILETKPALPGKQGFAGSFLRFHIQKK